MIEEQYKRQRELAQNIHLNMGDFNQNYSYYQNQNLNQNQKPQNLSSIEFNCNVLPKTILNNKQIKVTIQNPKPVEMGFFSSNYIVYEIETNILKDNIKWMVNRRYSDFINLRKRYKINFLII